MLTRSSFFACASFAAIFFFFAAVSSAAATSAFRLASALASSCDEKAIVALTQKLTKVVKPTFYNINSILQQSDVKNDPYCVKSWDTNSCPLKHESPSIITRPGQSFNQW